MDTLPAFHPEYVTDCDGNKKAVILPIAEYEGLLEDLHDLAVAASSNIYPPSAAQDVSECYSPNASRTTFGFTSRTKSS